MKKLREHWNSIFSNKADTELGWYEKDTSQTLQFLNEIQSKESDVIFLPGAGTSILVKDEKYTHINPFGEPRPYVYALYKRLHG